MSLPLAPVQPVPVAAPAMWWPSWGRCRSRLAMLSVPHSASSCLENTSGSHDLLALKKYFHLNYTSVSACGSPGLGALQSRAAVPARLGLCRWRSSAGGDAEAGAAQPPRFPPQSGLPGVTASSIGSCLLPGAEPSTVSIRPCLICGPRSPSHPNPAGVAVDHTRPQSSGCSSCGICGVGASLFPPAVFRWEDGARAGTCQSLGGDTAHLSTPCPGGTRGLGGPCPCGAGAEPGRDRSGTEPGWKRGRAGNGAGPLRPAPPPGPPVPPWRRPSPPSVSCSGSSSSSRVP